MNTGTGRPDRTGEAVMAEAATGEVVEELCAAVFEPLRRRDQRERGRQYVRGLLAAEGRKSIRNMALQTGSGGAAEEQALHHFIAGSTWDWQPIRTALAHYLGRSAPLSAWVVQPMAIPRGGEHSVGVGNRFDPHHGQVFRGQQALATWFISGGVATPVQWRLLLGGEGPAVSADSYEACAVAGAVELARGSAGGVRPVVLDVPDIATRATLGRFAEARVPVVARVSPGARLGVADQRLPGYGALPMAARDILQNVRGMRMPVEWADPERAGARRSSLVAAVRVLLAGREMLLFGEWSDARRLPGRMWVTDMTRAAPGALVRLTKNAGKVSLAAGASMDRVGLRDFAGRSLSGWHRHVTLASVAHAGLWLAGRLPPSSPAPAPGARPRRPSPALARC
ncbi:putative ISXo8 transposase [Streptomyces cirratus]|uniref:ISXo8 transposase n=1 Tax=Streptomyces cirratus TaxID=68187 RepID=A0ABQ3EZT3_9ACTN|nr:transposase [Streptomyces cirratus]GHB70089.1 putative ISXo8 transposase [Streptomyces cirratus]